MNIMISLLKTFWHIKMNQIFEVQRKFYRKQNNTMLLTYFVCRYWNAFTLFALGFHSVKR